MGRDASAGSEAGAGACVGCRSGLKRASRGVVALGGSVSVAGSWTSVDASTAGFAGPVAVAPSIPSSCRWVSPCSGACFMRLFDSSCESTSGVALRRLRLRSSSVLGGGGGLVCWCGVGRFLWWFFGGGGLGLFWGFRGFCDGRGFDGFDCFDVHVLDTGHLVVLLGFFCRGFRLILRFLNWRRGCFDRRSRRFGLFSAIASALCIVHLGRGCRFRFGLLLPLHLRVRLLQPLDELRLARQARLRDAALLEQIADLRHGEFAVFLVGHDGFSGCREAGLLCLKCEFPGFGGWVSKSGGLGWMV